MCDKKDLNEWTSNIFPSGKIKKKNENMCETQEETNMINK